MGCEKRLHPVSILFTLGSTARMFLVPGVALLFASRSGDWGWQVGAMGGFVPFALVALSRVLSFRYRLDVHELVIRSGIIFRSVRHVPYTRIHNLDAVQNPLHRLLGVAEVRIETGGGAETEAALQVISLDAVAELRRQLLEHRVALQPASEVTGQAQLERGVVLRLAPRELLLSGFLHARSAIVIGTAVGAIWELRLGDAMMDRVFGGTIPGGGVIRQIVQAVSGRTEFAWLPVGLAIAGFILLLVVLRVVSMLWALVALYGYTLIHQGNDVRAEFGLFTKVSASTPLRRIQTVTVCDGPLHRLFKRATVRVQTVGKAAAEGQGRPKRDMLAPILRSDEVLAFIRRILPGMEASGVAWRGPSPSAFRRAFLPSALVVVLFSFGLIYALEWWGLAVALPLLFWSSLHARLHVRHLGWRATSDAVFFKSGYLWRQTTIVPLVRVQAVTFRETPFDRRHRTAMVRVDTLGAGGAPHPVNIPYVPRDEARQLMDRLYAGAAQTRFSV